MRNVLPILLLLLVRRVPWLKKRGWRWFYQIFAQFAPDDFSLMNYGYAGDGGERIPLREEEEEERYGFQLYHHTVEPAEPANRDLLEVGCGRGGGTAFLLHHFAPKSVVGLDISDNAIELCNKRYQDPRLTFTVGDAEDLPFPEASFDRVVNIESAFCYPSREAFYASVFRVLRPGGFFLYADIEKTEKVAAIDQSLDRQGFVVVRREVINDAVLRACDLDQARRRAFVDSVYRGAFLRRAFYGFASVPGSFVYEKLQAGELTYLCYALRR